MGGLKKGLSYRHSFVVFLCCFLAGCLFLSVQADQAQAIHVFGTKKVPKTPANDQWSMTRGLWVAGDNVYVLFNEANILYVAKSTDVGVTWPTVTRVTLSSNNQYHGSLVVDGNGVIHVVWNEQANLCRDIKYARSTDGGASFSTPISVSGSGQYGYPRISIGGGVIGVIYAMNSSPTQTLYFTKSTDGGLSFTSPLLIADSSVAFNSPDCNPILHSDISVDANGYFHVVFEGLVPPGEYGVFYTKSTNGQTWTGLVRVNSGYGEAFQPSLTDRWGPKPVIDTDGSGNLYVAWEAEPFAQSTPHYTNIYFSKSADGVNWSAQQMVSDTRPDKTDNVNCSTPSLRVGTDSAVPGFTPASGPRLVIAWIDTRNKPYSGTASGIYFSTSGDGGATWSANVPVDDVMGNDNIISYNPSVGLNSNHQAFVGYAAYIPSVAGPSLQTPEEIASGAPVSLSGARSSYSDQADPKASASLARLYVVRGHNYPLIRVSQNPILGPGATGAWDEKGLAQPEVMQVGSTYYMFFNGFDANSVSQIGVATSPDGVSSWTKYSGNPIFNRNTLAGHANGVYSPVIIRSPDGWQAWVAGVSGSVTQGFYYTSSDGFHWTPVTGSPVISPSQSWEGQTVSPRSVIKNGSLYQMWYTGGGSIASVGYAESTDGITWTKYAGNPVFYGNSTDWDAQIIHCKVLYRSGQYYMTYTGLNLNRWAEKVGRATSSDGLTWTRYPGNYFTLNDTPWFGAVGSDWEQKAAGHGFWMYQPNAHHAFYYRGYGPWSPATYIALATMDVGKAGWPKDSINLAYPGGTTVADYIMGGFPLYFDSSDPKTVLGPFVEPYDPKDKRIGTWDATAQAYSEYPNLPNFGDPGFAGWVLMRNGMTGTLNGYKVGGLNMLGYLGLSHVSVLLQPGWNMVANPCKHAVDLYGVIVANNTGHRWLLAANNNLSQPAFYTYYRGAYLSANRLDPGQGGWVQNLTSGQLYIIFPDTTASFPTRADAAGLNQSRYDPPPPPPGGLTGTTTGGGTSGGGGCFIESIR